MIEIDLESNTAILLAIECFIEHSRYVMKEPIDKAELIANIEQIFHDKEFRRIQIERTFPQKKVSKESEGEPK